MSLRNQIKAIQRELGVTVDGIFGPVSAGAVLMRLDANPEAATAIIIAAEASDLQFSERSEKVIASLDPKAQPLFRQFLARAQATAATLGCEVEFVSGNRSCAEQNALYASSRPPNKGPWRTNAKCGQSNHNFAIAADLGVFRPGSYLDNDNPALAIKVHRACSEQAAACGLEWGGSWKTSTDLPHYEVKTGLTLAQKRKRFAERESVF